MTGRTIYSLSSGGGLAGVAVLRISGPDAIHAIEQMCARPVDRYRASLRQIFDPETQELLDEGLVIWFPGPNSFTGEDVVEFQIHGGAATIRAVLDGLEKIKGFFPAEAGEYTRRAFMNGRLDLVEIEGLGDLLHAQTEAQRRQALQQSLGSTSKIFENWRMELIAVLGYLEASIDFVEEEDIAKSAVTGLKDKLIHLRNEMSGFLDDSGRGQAIRDGVRVVLAGPPNVGKSSIMNHLAKEDVAIVSDIPGTTRDVLEVRLDLSGIPVILSDTAGLNRTARDEIEIEGINRTLKKVAQADLVLRVSSPDQENSMPIEERSDNHDEILVINKGDLEPIKNESALVISAKTGLGMSELIEKITEIVLRKFGDREPAMITRQRQKQALQECVEHLEQALALPFDIPELAGEQLRLAAVQLGRLVGRIDVEDLLDVIFRDFCVGK